MTHEEKALSYFQDKFHCSQPVLAAYAEELVLGMKYGQSKKDDLESRVASAVKILEEMG